MPAITTVAEQLRKTKKGSNPNSTNPSVNQKSLKNEDVNVGGTKNDDSLTRSERLAMYLAPAISTLAGTALGGYRGGAAGAQAAGQFATAIGKTAAERERAAKKQAAETTERERRQAEKLEEREFRLGLEKERQKTYEKREQRRYQQQEDLMQKRFQQQQQMATQKRQDLAQERERKKAEPGSYKGTQYQAAGFGRRMQQAEEVFEDLASKGFDRSQRTSALQEWLPGELQSPEVRSARQAERNFVNAVLRRESGAAISEQEFASAEQQYFPKPGDSPDVIAQKARNRQQAMNMMKAEAGGAWEQIPLVSMKEDGVTPEQRLAEPSMVTPAAQAADVDQMSEEEIDRMLEQL